MRTFMLYLLITTLTFGFAVNEASAKRFGGGRSFGVQRSKSSMFASHAPKSQLFGAQSGARKWGGAIGGLLAGGLLASMFMGHGGAGAGMLSWLVIGALAFFVIRFLRKKMQPNIQASTPHSFQNNTQQNPTDFFTSKNNSNPIYPANFTPETFLREAQIMFRRLQVAYDQNNKQDLRNFTAPEVFAEIEMQIDERNETHNHTEVISLNAELLDVSNQSDSMMASVRFTGSIKENTDAATQLDEIWHFRKFIGSNNWVVGGIQQANN